MSFLTCFCDFPQKEHFNRSPPSPIRGTYVLPALIGRITIRRGTPARSAPPRGEGVRVRLVLTVLQRRYLVKGPYSEPQIGVSASRSPSAGGHRASGRLLSSPSSR